VSKINRIRSGSGFGDSIYLQSIVKFLADAKMKLEVPSYFKELIDEIGVRSAPKSKKNIDIIAHYVQRKGHAGTTQFDDMCWSAGKSQAVLDHGVQLVDAEGHALLNMKLIWAIKNRSLVNDILAKSAGRKIIFLGMPRPPMDRTDGFAGELSPDWRQGQKVLDSVDRSKYYIIQMGKGAKLFEFKGLDLDLTNQTSVSDVLDVGSISSAFIGMGCSYIIPLSESRDKMALTVWSGRGLRSKEPFVSRITPTKIFHEKTSMAIIDDRVEKDRHVMEEFFSRIDWE